MKTAYYDSQLGKIQMKYEKDTLLLLKAGVNATEINEPSPFTDYIYRQICEYLNGERKVFDVKYKFNGTDFQERVWHILESIPYGEVMTYGEVARKIGSPKAVRAVGSACGKNQLWLVVPCHRVIGIKGSLTGYAGGIEMKEKLLRIERFGKTHNM